MSMVKEFPPLAVHTSDERQEVISVSPASKSTDASKLTVPLQMAVAAIIGALSVSAFYYASNQATNKTISDIAADIRVMRTEMAGQKELEKVKADNLELRFKTLEAKIETAGLRNAALSLSQELQKQKEAK